MHLIMFVLLILLWGFPIWYLFNLETETILVVLLALTIVTGIVYSLLIITKEKSHE